MPTYTYACKCSHSLDLVHSMLEKPVVVCPCCSSNMSRQITGGSGSYFKGMSGSKAYREKRYQKKRQAEIKVRQLEKYGGQNKLIPNVNGQETASWKEAAQLAKDCGANTSTYEKLKRVEDASKNSAGIDETRYTKLKEVSRNIR